MSTQYQIKPHPSRPGFALYLSGSRPGGPIGVVTDKGTATICEWRARCFDTEAAAETYRDGILRDRAYREEMGDEPFAHDDMYSEHP